MRERCDPRPRERALPYEAPEWPVAWSFRLPNVVQPAAVEFTQVLEARSSSRHLTRAPLREVANLLMFASGARQAWGSSPRRSLRPSHSAGAIHPISLLLVTGARKPRILRLDPYDARIELLRPDRSRRLAELMERAARIVPSATADILVLAAEPGLTGAVYEEANSLVWRDAGALMQTIHLCATALRLGLCPMGILGHEALEAVFGERPGLLAVGSAVIGRIVPTP